MSVLAARIIAGAWRELGAGYRRPAPTVCPVTACTLMAARGDGTSSTGRGSPSFRPRPVVLESGAT